MRYLILPLLALCLTACYSFKGISIPVGVETAYVPIFKNNAISAPPTLHLDVTETLRNKVRDEARLTITEDSPDIEMRGTLVDYRVSSEGARPGNETAAYAALNRLTIVVAIEYTNLLNPKAEPWKSNFSHYVDFPATQSLADIQDEATEEIIEQINEQIFNRAFADDW